MKTYPCVNCGYCCRQAPCGWGKKTSEKDHTCCHLVADPARPGRWLCGIYERIVGQPTADVAPAFGAGCCANRNTYRRAIIAAGPFVIFKRWIGQPATAQPVNQEEFTTREAAQARIEELRPEFPGREFAVVPVLSANMDSRGLVERLDGE